MNNHIIRSLKIVTPVLVLALGAAYAYAWTGPTQQPPGGNVVMSGASLPTGTSGQTLRHNGTTWVGDSNLFNNGTNVGIGTASPTYKLQVSGGPVYSANGFVSATKDDAGTMASGSGFFQTSAPVNYYAGASSWQHLIESRHTNDSNNYALQIAGSFFDQNLYFRKTNNSATTPWSKFVATDTSGNLTVTGELDATGGTGTGYSTAPIEVRTTATPRISFHWPGVVASQLGMDSAGTIRTYDNPGTGYAPFTAGGITATNRLTVSEANGAYTYITLRDDESPSGYKYIHANSNVVGFLNSGGGWSAYWDNVGNQYNVGSVNATDFYIRNTGKWASSLGIQPSAAINTNGDWPWTRVVANTYAPGPGNRTGWFYVGLDATRPVLGIKISGYSDDGGACIASIGNYFSGAVTNMAYINTLNLNGTWSGSAWNTNAGNMATGQWIFDGTPAGRNLGAQTYSQNTAYVKAAGLTYIPAGQGISYYQWYNDGGGAWNNTCYIDVLYATNY